MVCGVPYELGHRIWPRALLRYQKHAGFSPGRRELKGGFRCTTWKGNVSKGHRQVNRRKSPGVWFTCSKECWAWGRSISITGHTE